MKTMNRVKDIAARLGDRPYAFEAIRERGQRHLAQAWGKDEDQARRRLMRDKTIIGLDPII